MRSSLGHCSSLWMDHREDTFSSRNSIGPKTGIRASGEPLVGLVALVGLIIGLGLIITRTITTWLATASVWSAFSCETIWAGPSVVAAYSFDNCGGPWHSGDHRCCTSRQWQCSRQQPCGDHGNCKPTHDYPPRSKRYWYHRETGCPVQKENNEPAETG